MMKLRLKKLKDVSTTSIRLTIEYQLQCKFNQWVSVRRMQAYLLTIGADLSEEFLNDLMEDIYLESIDCPYKYYQQNCELNQYKCISYLTPPD